MSDLTIQVNGDERTVAAGTTVAELIEQLAGSSRGTAVVVDGEVVPRSAWSTSVLHPNGRVELITAVQGG